MKKRCIFIISLSAITAIFLLGSSIFLFSQLIKENAWAAINLTITSPGNKSVVRGTVNITIKASTSFTKVDLHFIQQANLLEFIYEANSTGDDKWTYSWNTSNFNDGTYKIYAAAVDASGNSSISPFITVELANEASVPPNEPDENVNSSVNTNTPDNNLNANINENVNNNVNVNINQNANYQVNSNGNLNQNTNKQVNNNANLNLNINNNTNNAVNANSNSNVNKENINANKNTNENIDSGIDSDEDGLTDVEEKKLGTDPEEPDTDGDGLTDGFEANHGFDPLKRDNATPPRQPDPSIVKLLQEARLATKPPSDSDNDGVPNDIEDKVGSNIFVVSTAHDGLTDLWKIENGYSPNEDLTQNIVKGMEAPNNAKKKSSFSWLIILSVIIFLGLGLFLGMFLLKKKDKSP